MNRAQIEGRLTAMGFCLVDETLGIHDNLKWRHRSTLNKPRYGSIWVKAGEVHATGVGAGYQGILTSWIPATSLDSIGYPVWSGRDLIALLDRMAASVTPATTWASLRSACAST